MAYITLNKAHLYHNLSLLCDKAGGMQRVMVVLKDNAYGHGLEEIAALVQTYGISKVAVKNGSEASRIAPLFDEVLVLVEQPTYVATHPSITLAIHSYEGLEQCAKGQAIHLSIDTGMHRNGIRPTMIDKALACIEERGLQLKGIMTHFRGSDEVGSDFFWQKRLFEALKETIRKRGYDTIAFHSHNSAALLRSGGIGDEAYARCGIALYGYTTLDPFFGEVNLKPVMALWAQKLSTRVLKKGERVGYGARYEALDEECVSTYDIGYGDGFFRFEGSESWRLESGQWTKGRMSMDSFVASGEAEELCLFGDANAIAKRTQTINYEIITKLSPFLRRIVLDQ